MGGAAYHDVIIIMVSNKRGWGADIFFLQSDMSMSSEATDSPSAPLDSTISDRHIAKIAKDFIRNWEELAPCLGLLPAQENEIKKDGRYGDQKREALRIWKKQNGRNATYRALTVVAKEASNVELAENIEALVTSHPTLREVRPSPAANVEKIQRDDESSKVFEAHAPGHYKHTEGAFVLALPCS